MTDQERLANLEKIIMSFGSAPSFAELKHRTLEDKGIAGPTAAHVIEEVHSPYNLAYLTFTTGSSAFQNIVGVTFEEIDERVKASLKAFAMAGVPEGASAIVTYAPLVNVYTRKAFDEHKMTWGFLPRSSRDAFLVALCRRRPQVVIGESSFIKVALEDAVGLGLKGLIPRDIIMICSGTSLDLDLLPEAEKYGWKVHDLYGCQEFGWLAFDGLPLRDDVSLVASPLGPGYREIVAGGLPLADSIQVGGSGHICNPEGKMLTYTRRRTHPEYEVWVMESTLRDQEVLQRAARTVLRIKGRVVKVDPHVAMGSSRTVLRLVPFLGAREGDPDIVIAGPTATKLFDDIVSAQVAFQSRGKTDPAWIKRDNG